MDDKLNAILDELAHVRGELKKKEGSAFERALAVLEKLVIPIMLGVLAYLGNQAATNISQGQLELARHADDDRKAADADRKMEFQRNMQAKYIEIFYKDLNSGDAKSQSNAIRLMRVVDSDLAQSLLDLVAATPGVSAEVSQQASAAKKEIEAAGGLRGYKIGIYYHADDTPSMAMAASLHARFKTAGYQGKVQDYASTDAALALLPAPKALEIRYEAGTEDAAAHALLALVQLPNTKEQWQFRNVITPSPNFITIFIPKGVQP